MIPSRNEDIEDRAQKAVDRFNLLNAAWDLDPEAFAKKNGLADATKKPKELVFGPYVKLICDCCGRVLPEWNALCFLPGFYDPRHYAERYQGFVRVFSKIYFGCRTECATTLFSIHHQYAMMEKSTPGQCCIADPPSGPATGEAGPALKETDLGPLCACGHHRSSHMDGKKDCLADADDPEAAGVSTCSCESFLEAL